MRDSTESSVDMFARSARVSEAEAETEAVVADGMNGIKLIMLGSPALLLASLITLFVLSLLPIGAPNPNPDPDPEMEMESEAAAVIDLGRQLLWNFG